jgi:iron complex transport system substrate-binding protein
MVLCRARALWGFVGLSRIVLAGLVWLAAGCTPPPRTLDPAPIKRPTRVVSLDYCADQFVLKLADRADILALSVDATKDFSYMRQEARGIAQVRSTAEDVLALKPDLIIRSYGGGPSALAFFEQAGIKVHQIGWGEDFDAVRKNTRDVALALGQPRKGEAVITAFDTQLAQIRPAAGVKALYVTRGGVTTGPGSMIDLMMTQAGLTNFQSRKGWNQLPLEQLVTSRPDMAIATFFNAKSNFQEYWSSARHPVVTNLLQNLPVAELDGSSTTCGGWFVGDAVAALAQTGRRVEANIKGGL